MLVNNKLKLFQATFGAQFDAKGFPGQRGRANDKAGNSRNLIL